MRHGFANKKLNRNSEKYDLLRIDHFVGFFKYWAIPNGESALNGHWRNGPWETFFDSIRTKVDFSMLLAEDLGVVLKDTETILKNYNIFTFFEQFTCFLSMCVFTLFGTFFWTFFDIKK